MYPAGIFGWKVAAKLGMPILVKFYIGYDEEAKVHIGRTAHLKGIFAEGNTLEELFDNIKAAAFDVIDYELHGKEVEVTPAYEETNHHCMA
jgi:predicted RNase H-like HicB family nuclease